MQKQKNDPEVLTSVPTERELAEAFIKEANKTPNILRHGPKALAMTVESPVALRAVMDAAGMKAATPITDFIGLENEIKPYLMAMDISNVIKQRFVDPTTSSLTSNERLSEGIIPRGAGTMHRPRLVDLCGGYSVGISNDPFQNDGRVGYWKPLDTFNARHGSNEEIGTISPEYSEVNRGVFYKYAFAIQVSRQHTRQDVTLASFGKWLDTVFLAIEQQMLNDYYGVLLKNGKLIESEALGASLVGTTYILNPNAWESLHEEFGTLHGMTDMFVHKKHKRNIKDLSVGNEGVVLTAGAANFPEYRNRLADGTYLWSQFLDEPDPDKIVAADRQSSASLYILDGSEISEREVNILSDVYVLTFSIALGFEVTDTRGVKVVNLTTSS